MNPFIYPTTCSVCGGPGVAHAAHYGDDWLGATFVHRDPAACEAYLRERRREEERSRQPRYADVDAGGGI